MQNIEGIKIRLLTESDIPAAMKLKEAAGWNQTENDWRSLLTLEPQGCFAATLNDELLGTTTTTTYGEELAWVGMVLVQPEKRRLGIATRLLRTALDYLHQKVATVKLDATVAGKPVYERLGFRVESLIERWTGISNSKAVANDIVQSVATLDETTVKDLFVLDRRSFGADRSELLNTLIKRLSFPAALARAEDGSLIGYSLSRSGTRAGYVGPIISIDPNQVEALLDRILSHLSGQRVYIDFNTASQADSSLLLDRGFVKERELVRMALGNSSSTTSPFVFAIAGPEVG
jgi:GNAT superfamily N-acetyltransferase